MNGPTLAGTQAGTWDAARRLMPGGVSSPVRTHAAVAGDPLVLVSGHGARVTDEGGNDLIDLQMAFGPLIVGHAHPDVVAAVQDTAAHGLHFGALHPLEAELARRVTELHPAVERVRFVNSGTEAVMSAVRLARGATGRDLVVKFEGGYHGHADALLAKAGSGVATLGLPGSAGVPAATAADTATLPLDDEAALESFFDRHGDRVACALVEGVPANSGLLPQRPEWHARLRRLTRDHGALLVVDEVITGFRLAWGGATEALGLEPDLVCLGKVLGGGLPVGAYGGRADLMAHVAPEGPVYQAGTLSGSPVAMAAGIATLDALARAGSVRGGEDAAGPGGTAVQGAHALLERQTRALARALRDLAEERRFPLSTPHMGSLLWLLPEADAAPRAHRELDPAARERYARLHRGLRRRGVFLPPSAYEVAFLSTAHTDNELDAVADAFSAAAREVDA